MVVSDLKEYILNNDCTEQILSELGCHHIINKGEYITCGNKDGDNKQAITIYLNDNLTCINYTRQLSKDKRTHDIFDLICFVEDLSFPEALKWTCDLLGIDYYKEPEEIPESLQILKMLKEMSTGDESEDNTPLKPIPEEILSYYLPYPNRMFEEDNIPLSIQKEFEIGYDSSTNYISIPIRDELGSLVGVKGRWFGPSEEVNNKYLYLERCNKSRVLYGYFQNKDYIKNSTKLFVVESEKSVMQLAGMGYRNAVSTGGKTISKTQVELITRTGCVPIFAFDQDVQEEELKSIADMFMDGISVYAIIDKECILGEKESPSDNTDKFIELIKNHIYQIRS
ncbi:MAG: DNA primase [Lachnospiraceae bacterium]